MKNFEEKQKIMKNKNKLKSPEKRIYIDSELTKNELDIQKKISQITEIDRKNGRKAKKGYKTGNIDGKE